MPSVLQNDAPRVTVLRLSMKRLAYSLEEEMYLPFNLSECLGVLMIDTMSLRSNMASSVPALNPDHPRACSFDRKR